MEHTAVFVVIVVAMILFVQGSIRYDVVALIALLALSLLNIIPADQMLTGFGHPAVITVALVLIISKGLVNGGIVDFIARWIGGLGERLHLQIAILIGVVIIASGFMNNIGALALLMPVAIRVARRGNFSPSILLMPLAFGSLLGGLMTLIGTPPNIIIATYRADLLGMPFGMFDFFPVGFGLAFLGGLFLILVGWRLVPMRQARKTKEDLFHIDDYITECRIGEQSPLANTLVGDIKNISDVDVVILGIVRDKKRLPSPSRYDRLYANDILILEAEPTDIRELIQRAKLVLVGSGENTARDTHSIGVMEVIVAHQSSIQGRTAASLNLRRRYGVNLLAVARSGKRIERRLSKIQFRVGDILLLQGEQDNLREALPRLGCLPLPERELQIGKPRRLLLSLGIFGLAIFSSAIGLLPIVTAMLLAVVLMLLLRLLSLEEAYRSIDLPIIVLLAAMLPIGEALETSGGAAFLAESLLHLGQDLSPMIIVAVVITATMLLSNIINNAATVVLMAPIAVQIAQNMNASMDAFLMAVAIGSSCAFLTPIGHQSNTLVMGPGGYEFGDYWRSGLPLSIMLVVLSTLLIPIFWGI